ncbi:PAS domain S-box protein [Natronolimnobius sp. AArcel1]|uniref:PAS domain S-box protein n=1 Tax=Natronolimnobius sp. AArcel1 TaxID=1679093 RepID=UPI0013ECD214|nr:PAS domain S-box protein [Natronolimnobius sp. AArcel1]NGM68834.1 PAS domain S-box protein [Natronolimnobius sp. AArcel1]
MCLLTAVVLSSRSGAVGSVLEYGGVFAPFVLGLAANGDRNDTLEQLTAEIESCVAQLDQETASVVDESDPGRGFGVESSSASAETVLADLEAFAADHEDEIGSLSSALSDLISTVRTREHHLEHRRAFTDEVIDTVDDLVYVLDPSGELRRWNRSVSDVTGYEDDTIAEMNAIEFFGESDRSAIETAVADALEEGTVRVEAALLTAEDERIPYEFSASALEDPDGNTVIAGVGRNIAERTDYEHDLERTTQLLAQVQYLSTVGGWEITAHETDNSANRQFGDDPDDDYELRLTDETARIHGLDPDVDTTLTDVLDIYHPDDRPQVKRALERALTNGERYDLEVRLIDGDGIRWVRTTGEPVQSDKTGAVVRGSIQNITEQKSREQRLEATTARLEALFENSPDIIDVLDEDGTILEVNQRFCTELGYTEAEVVGTSIWDYDAEFDASDVTGLLEDLAVGERQKFEGRFVRSDGSTFPIEVHLIRLDFSWAATDSSRTETTNRYLAICRDIGDRKTREQDLQETKRRLELALEGADAGIWEWQVDTDDIAWNETLERLLGLEPGGFEGNYEGFASRVHTDDIARVEQALQQSVDSGEPYRAEFRMRHTDDEWRWFVARGRLITEPTAGAETDTNGGTMRMLGTVNDITPRKRNERQLREREHELERYRAYTSDILDAIDDVVYVLNDDYELQRWNSSLSMITGYDDTELEEIDALEFIAPDDREAVRTGLDTVDNRKGAPLEADVITADGTRIPYEFVAAPLSDPDGEPVIAGVGRDISERVEKERQLSRLISNVPGFVYRSRNEPGWPIEYASQGVEEITGYEAQAFERSELLWGADIDRSDGIWETVQTALEKRESFSIVYPIETADGERRWLKEQGSGVYTGDDDTVTLIEGVVIDITERIEYEQQLERTTDLLDRTQRLAGVGGWELNMQDDPRTATWTEEMYRIHDLPRDTTPNLERTLACYHPEDRSRVRDTLETAITTESSYELEARLQTETHGTIWVRAMGEPIYDDDGDLVTFRGAVQDITEQKEREQGLEALTETARALLNAETEQAITELVAESATEVLESAGAAVYVLDGETNQFEPSARTSKFAAGIDELPSIPVGDSDSVLWNAYVAGSQTVIDAGATDDQSPLFNDDTGGLVAPIGDHGVFVLDTPLATIDDGSRQLFETLVATTEAAFDRLESEASLRERDAELETRNRRLRRQIEINDLIRRIDQSLIGAASRTEIERTVPKRLVESDVIDFAWIGTVDTGRTTLEARTWAGPHDAYLDAASLDLNDEAADAMAVEPAVRTAQTDQPTLVENIVDQLQQDPWRRTAVDAGFQSAIAVPLSFGDYTDGVLAVYATEPDAFTALERTVLSELGESIANAINAVTTREALHAETFVELTLEIAAETGDDILSRIAATTGGTVTYEGLGTVSSDRTVLFFEVADADSDAIETTLETLVAVIDYRQIRSTDAGTLFEATVTGDVLASRLVRHGGSPRSIRADGSATTVTVDVPVGADVREFVDMLRDHYANVDLNAQRHVERETQTRQELVTSLFESLTERQLEVLRTAYLAGFFEWPRESTGEEIAEMLEVTQPTVNRHLRVGQQQLFAQLFDEQALALDGDL